MQQYPPRKAKFCKPAARSGAPSVTRQAMVCIYNAAPVIKITCCIDYVQLLFDMQARNPGKTIFAKAEVNLPFRRRPWCGCCVSVPMLTTAQNPGYSGTGSELDRAPSNQFAIGSEPILGSVAQGKVTPEPFL